MLFTLARQQLMDDFDHIIKILLIGDTDCGKTCLLTRFVDNSFQSSFIATIGLDFKSKFVDIDGKRIKLQVWDTAGQERFRTITNAYFRGAMGVILVCDVTNRKTFENLDYWVRSVKQHANQSVVRWFVGNKMDLPGHAVSADDFIGLCSGDDNYAFTSAKTGEGVEDLFLGITKSIFNSLSASERNYAERFQDDENLKIDSDQKEKSGCC